MQIFFEMTIETYSKAYQMKNNFLEVFFLCERFLHRENETENIFILYNSQLRKLSFRKLLLTQVLCDNTPQIFSVLIAQKTSILYPKYGQITRVL